MIHRDFCGRGAHLSEKGSRFRGARFHNLSRTNLVLRWKRTSILVDALWNTATRNLGEVGGLFRKGFQVSVDVFVGQLHRKPRGVSARASWPKAGRQGFDAAQRLACGSVESPQSRALPPGSSRWLAPGIPGRAPRHHGRANRGGMLALAVLAQRHRMPPASIVAPACGLGLGTPEAEAHQLGAVAATERAGRAGGAVIDHAVS